MVYVEASDENRARAIERWSLPPEQVFRSLEEAVERVQASTTSDVGDSELDVATLVSVRESCGCCGCRVGGVTLDEAEKF